MWESLIRSLSSALPTLVAELLMTKSTNPARMTESSRRFIPTDGAN
jgi:hypothetical protein